MVDLTIRFTTKEQAQEFATWLCESGEQQYWEWGEHRIARALRSPKDFVSQFDYHNGGATIKEFCSDMTIRTQGIMVSEDFPSTEPFVCTRCQGHGVTHSAYPKPLCPICKGSGIAENV